MSPVVWQRSTDASAFYRLTEPARVTGTMVVEHPQQIGAADTIVLNRPLEAGVAEQIRLWVAEGRRVVVDLDDCFDTVSPDHQIAGRYTTEHLHLACKTATVVTCSTPALAGRYGYGHGEVLRNRIPAEYLSIQRRTRIYGDEPMWVGWYGSLGSHPNDPAAAGSAVGAVLNGTAVRFMFVGPPDDGPRLREIFGLREDVIAPGYVSMQALPGVLAELDVGIVPLEPTLFNEAKSGLKGLELAAVGVPVVASPTGEYMRMAREGGCVVAADFGSWDSALWALLTDDTLRREQAAQGRAWAAGQTYEEHAGAWRDVWYSHDHA